MQKGIQKSMNRKLTIERLFHVKMKQWMEKGFWLDAIIGEDRMPELAIRSAKYPEIIFQWNINNENEILLSILCSSDRQMSDSEVKHAVRDVGPYVCRVIADLEGIKSSMNLRFNPIIGLDKTTKIFVTDIETGEIYSLRTVIKNGRLTKVWLDKNDDSFGLFSVRQ